MKHVLVGSAIFLILNAPGRASSAPSTLAPSPFCVQLPARAFAPAPGLDAFSQPGTASDRHLLVQPEDPADPGWRNRAEAAGLRLVAYVPANTWVALVPSGFSREKAAAAGLRWAGPLEPADRVAPSLRLSGPGAWAVLHDGRARLRVAFFDDVPAGEAREILRAAGAEIAVPAGLHRPWTVIAFPAAIAALSAEDGVRWIIEAPSAPIELNDGARGSVHVDPLQSSPYLLSGNGVRAGMWDSGDIDGSHPDLAGRIHIMETAALSAHSTHVAGTLAGTGVASASHGGSAFQWKGMAPAVGIWDYTFFGDPVGEHNGAIGGQAIDLSQNSWGYSISVTEGSCGYYGDYVWDAPEYDAIVTGLYGRRIPVVFAVGNERDDGDCGIDTRGGHACIAPPATAKNVITVGAIQSDTDAMTPFSSWGPTSDGRIRPDLVAPGCQAGGDLGIKSPDLGGIYVSRCGTSQAAPVVSGALALALEEYRLLYPGAPAPLPSTYKALLAETARDLGLAGPDYRYGFGALDIRSAIDAMRTQSLIEDSVATGATRDIVFTVPAGTAELRVTLAWDDPAAADGAPKALVNDLDLELIDPSLAERRPLVPDPAAPSAAATAAIDTVNNMEQVVVAAPPAGIWICRITGQAVPMGPQRFSIAGIDRRAPANVSGIALSAVGDSTIQVRWTNPEDLDFAATLVVRGDAVVNWSPVAGEDYTPGTEVAPGVRVIAVDPADHSVTPVVDGGRPTGATQHYRLFSFDRNRNYAPGAADSIMAGSPVPVLTETSPVAAALAVSPGADVSVSFNLSMDPASFDSASFRVIGSVSGVHAGSVTMSGADRVVSLDPARDFIPGEEVRVAVSSSVRSAAGYAVASGLAFNFVVDAPGTGLAEFTRVQEPATGAGPTEVRAADLDADGDADALVANRTAGTLTVLRNQNGVMAAEPAMALGAGAGLLATGDLDGDGRTDAVAALGASSALTVLRNEGGMLVADTTLAPGDAAGGIVVSDFDMDGRADIAVTVENLAAVKLFRNTGGGRFAAPVSIAVLPAPRAIIVGDVDGDHDPDLVVCCANANAVRVLSNQGNGTFQTSWTGTVLAKPSDAALADFDGDHDLDLAVLRRTGTAVDVLWNTGTGVYAPGSPASYTVGSAPWNLAAFDADGDDDIDLAMTVNGISSLALLRNQGGGAFGGLATSPLPAHPVGIAAAELTGDGDVDLIVALTETGSAAIMHNISAATGVGAGEGVRPTTFALYGSRENPFRRGETVIGYSLDRDRAVTLVLYDVAGRKVRALADGLRAAGYHDVRWDGRDEGGRTAAPGIYFLRLTAGKDVVTRKLVIAP